MPRFSILICVHDRFSLLLECLRNLAPEVHGDTAEVVIACDGGAGMRSVARDEAADIARNLIPGLVWLDLPHGGPAKARNVALGHCAGELILFLNDDVRFEPGLLAAHDRWHRERPGHAVMGNTRWAPEVIDSEFMHWVAHHDSFYYLIPAPLEATWEYFHTMNLSIDRRWFDNGARFDESFPDPAFEDTEMGYRLCRQGLRITLAYDAILYHVHRYTPEAYIQKSEQRGRSARRFCTLYPELEERIISEYRQHAARIAGLRGRARLALGRLDPVEKWESLAAQAFMRGYGG